MGGLPRKINLVEELTKDLEGATILLVTDFRGLKVSEMRELRKELYAENTKVAVVKNTLLKRVIKGTVNAPLEPYLKGPSALLIGKGDQVKPVKILRDYLKKNKKAQEMRGGLLDGVALDKEAVLGLADLPSLEVLQGKLVGSIAHPVQGLVRTLNTPMASVVYALSQLAESKQASS